MKTSQQLLADYLTSGSETAFRELVTRYTGLVYSTALRLVEGDTHRAEDITQTVFLDLARLAHKLSAKTMLGGWLYRHTCFAAAETLRTERRRQVRERQAVDMNAHEDHAAAHFAQVAPVLDEAMNQLSSEDQSAIVLRFFERLDFPSVGEALGSTEEAARKRVNRALDKLHELLTARGVTLSATALGTVLAARAVEAAPAAVVASVAQAALAGAAAGHGTALSFLKAMTASKVGLGVAGAAVLATVSWLSWSLWAPWWSPKPAPLALKGTWSLVSKPLPPGHFISPTAVTVDPDGQLYMADFSGARVQKRDRDGSWSVLTSWIGFGYGTRALTCDASGNLYVAQWGSISKRDREGRWTSLAREGKELGKVLYATAMALDRAGNLYVIDWAKNSGDTNATNRIVLRKPDSEWAVLAGEGTGVGQFQNPDSLAIDLQGNLYVTESRTNRMQMRDTSGRWSIIDMNSLPVGTPDGLGFVAVDGHGARYVSAWSQDRRWLLKGDANGDWSELTLPDAESVVPLSLDSAGALYALVSAKDTGRRIEKRDPNGTWTLVCASPTAAATEPGVFWSAGANLAVDSHANLYVVDPQRRQTQKRDTQGHWTVVLDGDNPDLPADLPCAVDGQDNLYVADYNLSRVMARDSHGEWKVCMASGTGIGQTQRPTCLGVDASDNLYVVDDVKGGRQARLQKRDRQGRWTVLTEASADPKRQIGLGIASAVAAAPDGTVYVLGMPPRKWQQLIRMRDLKGRWTTIAPAGSEQGQFPALATDLVGRLYVAEFDETSRVHIRDANGKWLALTNNPSVGQSEFPATVDPLQGLNDVTGVAVDRQGVVYVTTASPCRVLCWTPQPESQAATAAPTKNQ